MDLQRKINTRRNIKSSCPRYTIIVFIFLNFLTSVFSALIATEYLHQFGWLDSENSLTPSEIKADREYAEGDNESNAALKNFQNFFGLKPTGVLDNATMTLMNTPRCGVQDKFGLSPRSKRYVHLNGRWPKSTLTYRIRGYPDFLSKDTVDVEIMRAFEVWQQVTNITFSRKSLGDADIDIRFQFEHPCGSTAKIYFQEKESIVLAHAYSYTGENPLGEDIHFNHHRKWTVNTDEGYNLFLVAAHEIGHVLGLDHSNVKSALMYPMYSYNPNFILDWDDIIGVEQNYPKSKQIDWRTKIFTRKTHSGRYFYINGGEQECQNFDADLDNESVSMELPPSTDSCVRLYEDENCVGKFKEFKSGDGCLGNFVRCEFAEKASSASSCNFIESHLNVTTEVSPTKTNIPEYPDEGGVDVRIRIIREGKRRITIKILGGNENCTNILYGISNPDFAYIVPKGGVCARIYEGYNCQGKYIQLEPNRVCKQGTNCQLDFIASSVSRCSFDIQQNVEDLAGMQLTPVTLFPQVQGHLRNITWQVIMQKHIETSNNTLYIDGGNLDCVNIYINDAHDSLVTKRGCVYLYKDYNCVARHTNAAHKMLASSADQFVFSQVADFHAFSISSCFYNKSVPDGINNDVVHWKVGLYEESEHKGVYMYGEGKDGDCENIEMWLNDKVSSVDIYDTPCARLFEHFNCQGEFLEINSNTTKCNYTNLAECSFDNIASSIGSCTLGDETNNKMLEISSFTLQYN